MSATFAKKGVEEDVKVIRPKIESFDDVLPYVDEAGRYQWFLIFILMPFTVGYAFLYFAQYFITLLPEDYWCRIPELDNTTLTDAQKIALSIPPDTIAGSSLSYSRCRMYDTNYTQVLATNRTRADPKWPTIECKYGHNYNMTNVPYLSIAAEQDWVCDKVFLSSEIQSIFYVGSIIGGFVFGYVADHYGRLPALVVCNGVGFFASITTAFCNDFWSFALSRLVVGTAFDNCYNIIFIIVIEYIGQKYRTLITNISLGLYFAIASGVLPWIAYWIRDWRMLSIVCALPLTVAFVTPWIVPESARWYITNGRVDKAIAMLKKFEKVNRKNVPAEVYEEFERNANVIVNNDKQGNNYTVLDLFKLPRLARINATLVVYWMLIILVFDGHVWNMKLLHPNVFTSFSLAALTELPAAVVLVLLLDRWGRRWMGFISLTICGIFSFVAIGYPKGAMAMAMAIIARFGVNVSTNLGFQWAAEILPTVVRAQGISLIHICGYLAYMVGPYIVHLANVHPSLPLTVLGSLAFVGAALTLVLPETLHQELPGSLEEGNVFGKNQNFWWFPCINASPRCEEISMSERQPLLTKSSINHDKWDSKIIIFPDSRISMNKKISLSRSKI